MQYLKLHALAHCLWPVLSLFTVSNKSKIKKETLFYENKKLDG